MRPLAAKRQIRFIYVCLEMDSISKAAGKGWKWYKNSDPAADATPKMGSVSKIPNKEEKLAPESLQLPELGSKEATNIYWNFAQDAADQTYSTVTGLWSSYTPYLFGGRGEAEKVDMQLQQEFFTSPTKQSNSSVLTSPTFLGMFRKNPYVDVRGGRTESSRSSSMEAVRTLLKVTSPEWSYGNDYPYLSPIHDGKNKSPSSLAQEEVLETPTEENLKTAKIQRSIQPGSFPSPTLKKEQSQSNLQSKRTSLTVQNTNPSETASHIVEGTLRAFRDIALDEAVELHSALSYWSYRWERPFLSWLEAGPIVWFSEEGYQHRMIGQKVAQIQAVLARRCATIGDLQQHLLRAGWQQGVAHWGVLGDGGEWAAVAGFDGRMPQETTSTFRAPKVVVHHHDIGDDFNGNPSPIQPNDSTVTPIRRTNPRSRIPRISSELSDFSLPPQAIPDLPRQAPSSRVSNLPHQRTSARGTSYYTSISVKNNPGGQIVMDKPALAEWTVDAMSIVRRQLYRAGNGRVLLPYAENWAQGDDQSLLSFNNSITDALDDSTAATNESYLNQKLPLWAGLGPPQSTMPPVDEHPAQEETSEIELDLEEHHFKRLNRVSISNLPLLVQEVSGILDVMEGIMDIQRARRLEKLKAPSMLQRCWYLYAAAIPSIGYYMYKTADKKYGWEVLRYAAQTLSKFCREHVVEPFLAIYNEVTKGTDNISDHEARDAAIESLQKMIRSWLDEMYPNMPESERAERAKAMDVTLIESQKEASMKTIYELNSVIRMSFIEAQFIKKVCPTQSG